MVNNKRIIYEIYFPAFAMNILVGMRTVLRVLGFGWHKYKK